jgi:hypothetical protein
MQRFYLDRLEHLKEFEWDAIRKELAVFVIECPLAIHAPIGGGHFHLDWRLWRAVLEKVIPHTGPTVNPANRLDFIKDGMGVFRVCVEDAVENHVRAKFGSSVSKEAIQVRSLMQICYQITD